MLDAIVSVGVVIAGFIISYTGIKWIDPLISILIMVVVLYSTWGLLTESLKLSLDGVPSSIDMEKIKAVAVKIDGIKEIHHIHIWAMSTTKNAMTAHLILENDLNENEVSDIKHEFKHQLQHLNIQHVTLETELIDCKDNC
jgi:cobalt-zinc-cadmium efflux system protein